MIVKLIVEILAIILVVIVWRKGVLSILREIKGLSKEEDLRTELLLRAHPVSLISLVLISFLTACLVYALFHP